MHRNPRPGRHGALAGVGAASTIYGVLIALMFGADAAVQAIVSRRAGAGRSDLFGQILTDALAITLPLGGLVSFGLWLAAPVLVSALAPDRGAALIAAPRGCALAAPSVLLLGLTIPINAGWIGSGRPAVAFRGHRLSWTPVQIAATYALVFGAGPIAAMGGPGLGPGRSRWPARLAGCCSWRSRRGVARFRGSCARRRSAAARAPWRRSRGRSACSRRCCRSVS